ncbi:MAG: flagellar hook-associated protein FlgL [Steroidobacteraceae bacterium]
MRLSTSMIHSNAVSAMLKRQTEMSKTQTEVSSGLRVQTPSDDPVAAVKILQLEQSKSANAQYGTNISTATTRLEQEEQALADSNNVLQRVYELAIQANSSALSQSDRQSIATELGVLNKQLVDVANRKDANGEFLFAGLSSGTQPFARDAANSISYAGDAATRSLQIGAAQYVEDGNSGRQVFMNVPQGNGTFVSSAATTNAGTGIISGAVLNAAAWVADDYTLSFSSASDWRITDSSSAVVATGSGYVAGTAISFNGIQVSVSGNAASGDSFIVARSRKEDVFTTIDSLVSTITSAVNNGANQAQFQNRISNSLQQLDQAATHITDVRTGVGARLSLLQSVSSTQQDSATQIESSLSAIRDSDYTEAVSRLTQQSLALQAAQQSYVKIAQLSLFNYL